MLKSCYENEWRQRRAFLAGQFVFSERERCVLVLTHPNGSRFEINAEAVYLKSEEPGAGVGLDLVGLDATSIAALEDFISEPLKPKVDVTATPKTVYERIRQMSLRERETVARQGQLSERVALERAFGSSVWESLLQNPQLTAPEVTHIAKNGTIPAPIASLIIANGAWISVGEVRRALMSNPRVTSAQCERLLRATPRNELRQIVQSPSYRAQIRTAAKKLLGD